MMNRLSWITKADFMNKELWAPFILDSDIKYYDDLCKKYRILLDIAIKSDADEESIKIIKKYTLKIREAIRKYYSGHISTSHTIIKNLLKDIVDNPLAVSDINSSKAFPGISREIQFFRARTNEEVTIFKPKDMLHIPFDMRGKTGNYRFSIPGIPSLYLGNTSYACWLELGCPAEYRYNVSPVLLDGTQKILNLAVMTRKQFDVNDCNAEYVHCWLKLLCLMIATSYVIKERDRSFKSEYIVSQSIMLGCKELGLDGVAYFSKRVEDEAFAYAAINAALFTKYEKGKKYSDICKHIKIDESYNYALYKQLGNIDKNKEYRDYRVLQTGLITNIGKYNRQFNFGETEFCKFDKFLFATWKDKEKINFGNALE